MSESGAFTRQNEEVEAFLQLVEVLALRRRRRRLGGAAALRLARGGGARGEARGGALVYRARSANSTARRLWSPAKSSSADASVSDDPFLRGGFDGKEERIRRERRKHCGTDVPASS